MKYLILSLYILSLVGCGKCQTLTVVAMVPGHSTTGNVYQGPCSSTFNDNWDTYEIQWSDGTSLCMDRQTASAGYHVGDKKDYCN